MAPEATGKLSTTTARAPPSERKALGWLKSLATPVRHRGFLGGALVRLHRLDPQRRTSSISPGPCRTGSARPSGTGRVRTDHRWEVIEAALAHVVRNRVEAAYARSDLFEQRRVLIDDWARYLAQGRGKDREL